MSKQTAARPNRWAHPLKGAAILGLAILAQGWAAPALAACKLKQVAELPITMVGARPTIPVKVNGRPAQFVLDSGAFYSMLSPEAAARLGLDAHFEQSGYNSYYVRGAGGDADLKSATIDTFTLADLPFRRMQIAVAQGAGDGTPGPEHPGSRRRGVRPGRRPGANLRDAGLRRRRQSGLLGQDQSHGPEHG